MARESDVHLPKLLLVQSQDLIGSCNAPLLKVGFVLTYFESVEPFIYGGVVEGADDNS